MDAADLHLDNNIHDHILELESFDETVRPDLGDETLGDDVEIISDHEPSEPSITRKKRKAAEPYSESRLKSLVWKSYTRILDENGIATAYVTCNICQRKYKGVPGSGSSQLRRHNDWHKVQDEIEKNKKDGQPTIAQSTTGLITSFKYNPQEARIGFAEMIVQAELPFSFVENPYFTKWIQKYLQPMYRPVTRNTVKADLFKGYEPEKLDLISYFSNFPGKVCLTTDLWRSSLVQAFEDYSKHVDYDRLYKPMVDDMRAKFDKYWKPLPLLFGIAALFDPRYKQKVLENILKFIYGETDGKIQLKNIMEKTKDLFDVYSSLYGGESHIPSSSTSTSISSQGRFDRLSCLFTPSGPTQSTTTELQRYLDERLEDNSSSSVFDILRYWKLQSERYHILTSMACDLLSAQVSSVASEQAFSTGKRVISDHRCSLTPESIEVTMCREDWLRARDREQENVSTMKLQMDTYFMTLGDLDEFEENEDLGVDD